MATQRFTKRGKHYHDRKTGLLWSRTLGRATWADAPAMIARELGPGWRIPAIEELSAVVDYARHAPATELPDTQSGHYWSASTYAPDTYSAWIVSFDDGYVYAYGKPYYNYYVRAVRGGS